MEGHLSLHDSRGGVGGPLRLERPASPDAPEVLYVEDVCKIMRREPTPANRRWVMRNVAPAKRRKVGKTIFWRRTDVLDWLRAG